MRRVRFWQIAALALEVAALVAGVYFVDDFLRTRRAERAAAERLNLELMKRAMPRAEDLFFKQ